MKRTCLILALALVFGLLSGCAGQTEYADIAATTLPVYQFTSLLCQGTGLTVTRLVTENVSCLHDYSLNVRQVKAAEAAQVIVMNGAGLEDFMADILADKHTIDASAGIVLLDSCHSHEDAHHQDQDDHHGHEADAHIWLSPVNAMTMAENICNGLKAEYPQHAALLEENLIALRTQLLDLLDYGNQQLAELSSRDLITFHDGFTYFAHSFDLEILAAVEEESGSEASAQELITLIRLVQEHDLPAIFIEENGSPSAAGVISAETGAGIYTLNMAMSGDDYFAAMYQNIDTIKEALG